MRMGVCTTRGYLESDNKNIGESRAEIFNNMFDYSTRRSVDTYTLILCTLYIYTHIIMRMI